MIEQNLNFDKQIVHTEKGEENEYNKNILKENISRENIPEENITSNALFDNNIFDDVMQQKFEDQFKNSIRKIKDSNVEIIEEEENEIEDIELSKSITMNKFSQSTEILDKKEQEIFNLLEKKSTEIETEESNQFSSDKISPSFPKPINTQTKNEIEKNIVNYKSGIETAFDNIYKHYKPILDRLGSRLNNDDISQELSIVLYHAVEHFDNTAGARFNTFFWKCARNYMGRNVAPSSSNIWLQISLIAGNF